MSGRPGWHHVGLREDQIVRLRDLCRKTPGNKDLARVLELRMQRIVLDHRQRERLEAAELDEYLDA